MADYLIKDTTLNNLADKIRVLSGSEESMTPVEMASELDTFTGNLVDALNNIADSKADKEHTHEISEITDLQAVTSDEIQALFA